jgi:hypothetical protein
VSRRFAIFIRIIGIIAALLEFFSLFFLEEVSFLTVLLCIGGAALTLIYSFAYAENIDMTLDHKETLEQYASMLKKLNETVFNQQKAAEQGTAQETEAARPESEPKDDTPAVTPTPVPGKLERVKCPLCGEVQSTGRARCQDCGIPFVTI